MEQQQKSRPSRWQRVSRALLSISPLLLLVGVAVALIRFARLQRRAAPTYQAPAQLADADGAFIMVNGMQIYYRARGPVDGQAIILVHGFLLETATFEPLLEALAGGPPLSLIKTTSVSSASFVSSSRSRTRPTATSSSASMPA